GLARYALAHLRHRNAKHAIIEGMKARLWPLLPSLALAAAGQSLPGRWRQWSLPPLDRVPPLDNRDLNLFGLQFHLLDGELTLSAPVEGVVATAVCSGAGELTVLPPDA